MKQNIKALLDSLRGRGITNIGLPWYESGDYKRIKTVMEDGNNLPISYGEWEANAKAIEEALGGEGYTVIRANLRSSEFVQWCKSTGHHINSQGRNAFANFAAMKGNSQVH